MEPHPNATTDSLDAEGPDAGSAGDAGDRPVPRRVETDRLPLRRLHPDEIEFERLHALFADPTDAEEVFELCAWNVHEDEAETREYLDQQVEA
jgi:hypothetical protein